jgi:colicin import membrane protein
MPVSKRQRVPDMYGNGSLPRALVVGTAVSAVLHLGIVVAIALAPHLAPPRKINPNVVNVSLVSLPAPGPVAAGSGAAAAPKTTSPPPPPAKEKKPAVREEKPADGEQKPIAVAPPAVKPKTSLKKKTYQPSKIVDEAVSRIEEKVEEHRHPSIEEALNRLQREVEKGPAQTAKPGGNAREAPAAGGGGAVGTASVEAQQRLRIYQAEIAYQIQKNWAFSEQLAGGRSDLEAALGIKIMPDGEIRDIWFDQRSGNRHLDESAYRALVKSNPLPPLPQGLFDGPYTVGLKFDTKGLKR